MNTKNFSILTIALVAAFALCGCGPTENKLALKIEAGDQYKLNFVTIADVDSMGSKSIEQDIDFLVDVVSKEENGDFSLKLTYDYVKTSMEGGGAGPETDLLRAQASVLKGKIVTLKLSPSGRVQDLDGHLEIQDAIVDAQSEAMKEMMKGMPAGNPMAGFLGEGFFREQASREYGLEAYDYLMSQIVMPRPTEPMKAGGSWQCKMATPGAIPCISDTTYTIKSLEGDKAVIEVASTISVDPQKSEMDMGGMKMKYDISGTSKGTITLDNASGFVTSASFQATLTGEMTISGAMMPQSMTMPMNVQVTTTVSPA